MKTFVLKSLPHPIFFLIFLLGFSSGLPLALTGATLQFWYTAAGFSLVSLGLLNLVGQAYTFKFIWAPLMDRFKWPLFGRRRGWMLCTQILLIASLSAMAFVDPAEHPWRLALLGILTAFFSASQDIAVDAYRTDVLTTNNLGLGNAFFTTGYRLAVLVSGGIGLIFAGYLGFKVMYLLMAALMLLGVLGTLMGKEPICSHTPKTLQEALIPPFKVFLQKPLAWIVLIFIVFYKLGDAFAFSLLGPFLMRTLHLSLQEIGTVYKTVGLLATLTGAFIGGVYLKRLGLYRALLIFGILQGVSTLFFILLTCSGKSYPLLIAAIVIENLTSGMGTIAFLSFLMHLCDHHYSATQFALLSSLSAVGRVYIGPFAGFFAERYGWADYFFMGFLLSLPGLFLLWWLKKRVKWPFVKSEK
ncbi:MAG: MFS transporter [Gammaproteobacteria bacterium]|nr:MFS transporter [Gammaproteobacteria bacterium]